MASGDKVLEVTGVGGGLNAREFHATPEPGANSNTLFEYSVVGGTVAIGIGSTMSKMSFTLKSTANPRPPFESVLENGKTYKLTITEE